MKTMNSFLALVAICLCMTASISCSTAPATTGSGAAGGGGASTGSGDSNGGGEPAGEQTFAGIEFVWCPPGTFMMGSDDEEAQPDEQPVHQVTLSKGFWIGKYEVTQAQWEAVMGSNPSLERHFGPNIPVDTVSWDDVQEFITALNEESGESFRLPTEAEWEYACRAGTTTEYSFGDEPGDFNSNYLPLNNYAWNSENSDTEEGGVHISHEVGQLLPNGWGIHDMHGNVREWCQDWYGDYSADPATDPQGPESGEYRVHRGGARWMFATFLRSARRSNNNQGGNADDIGFRLVRAE